jgi:hypothetical protein
MCGMTRQTSCFEGRNYRVNKNPGLWWHVDLEGEGLLGGVGGIDAGAGHIAEGGSCEGY